MMRIFIHWTIYQFNYFRVQVHELWPHTHTHMHTSTDRQIIFMFFLCFIHIKIPGHREREKTKDFMAHLQPWPLNQRQKKSTLAIIKQHTFRNVHTFGSRIIYDLWPLGKAKNEKKIQTTKKKKKHSHRKDIWIIWFDDLIKHVCVCVCVCIKHQVLWLEQIFLIILQSCYIRWLCSSTIEVVEYKPKKKIVELKIMVVRKRKRKKQPTSQ